jgi:Helix-turn-helix domain
MRITDMRQTITHQGDVSANTHTGVNTPAGENTHAGVKDVTPRWLSVSKACHYCSMGDERLMQFVRAGDIYGTKKGGKWYIDRFSIDRFFGDENARVSDALADLKRRVA